MTIAPGELKEVAVSKEMSDYWGRIASKFGSHSALPEPTVPYKAGDVICYHDINNFTSILVIDLAGSDYVTGFRLYTNGCFPVGSRFTWAKEHGRYPTTTLLWRRGVLYYPVPGVDEKAPLPLAPGLPQFNPHDLTNPYLLDRASGSVRCDKCGLFPEAATTPVGCVPNRFWRLDFERSLFVGTKSPATPAVKWTGYKAPNDLLGPALQETRLCGLGLGR